MDETYASNIDNLNERLREYKQSQVDKASDLNEAATEKFNKQLAEYSDKWKAIQDAGQDELGAMMGIKGAYAAGKKAYQVYKKYKGKNAPGDEDDEEEEGQEGDPQADKLDEGNDPAPLTDEDRAALRDPLKESRALRQSTQDRMNARLKELGFGDDDSSETVQSGNPSGSAAGNEADVGTGTSDADHDAITRAFQEAPREESAFGDLSGIPEEGTAENVMFRLNAAAATQRGGNIGKGGAARGKTNASDTVQDAQTEDRPLGQTDAGQPASGAGTEGGNSAPVQQSESSYNPEGSQAPKSTTLEEPKAPATQNPQAPNKDPLNVEEDLAPEEEEGGGFLGDLLGSEAATAAIPFVGEAAAVIGGFVAIGEGIYHLFHPPAKKLPPAPIAGSLVPQSVQAKYANALPSFDSSSDNQPSDAVF